jgi:uncharacterized LabA/DUF88 family protein
MPRYNNYAYIDGANLHYTYENIDWEIDYKKLIELLKVKYEVIIAHYFIGNTPATKPISDKLTSYGYNIKLKDPSPYTSEGIICSKCGEILEEPETRYKADVDSYLTMQVMTDFSDFNKAVIISSDGDYDELVKRLVRLNKLRIVFAPCREGCSKLLKRAAVDKIAYMDDFKEILEKVEESSYGNLGP